MTSPSSTPASIPFKPFAVVRQSVELDPGLETLVSLKILQPGQGAVDAGDETSRV